MSGEEQQALVSYRIKKAKDTLAEVDIQVSHELWGFAINRLYYACYYAAIALLIQKGLHSKTHSGVKLLLGQHFIEPGIFDKETGKFYAAIFKLRQTGDYDDFVSFDEEKVRALVAPAKNWLQK